MRVNVGYQVYRLRLLPFFAFILSLLFWSVDSVIDFLIFEESESIWENIIAPEPMELWMRCLVVILLIGFSFYARYLLKKEMHASHELKQYKNELEEVIALRTNELESKNKELQNEIKLRKKIEETLKKIAGLDNKPD